MEQYTGKNNPFLMVAENMKSAGFLQDEELTNLKTAYSNYVDDLRRKAYRKPEPEPVSEPKVYGQPAPVPVSEPKTYWQPDPMPVEIRTYRQPEPVRVSKPVESQPMIYSGESTPPKNTSYQNNRFEYESRPEPVPVRVLTKEEISERNITTILNIGVILILLSGVIFGTTSWDIMNNVGKAILLCSVSVLFFVISVIAKHLIKIEKSSNAFWIMGSLLLPITLLSIGSFQIFGTYLSIWGEGKYLFGVLCSLLCLPVYIFSTYRNNSRTFAWITLINFTALFAFLSLSCNPSSSVFVLSFLGYNGLIFALTLTLKNAKKCALFLSELPVFLQFNLILCTAITLFTFHSSYLYSLNIVVASMLFFALSLSQKREAYDYVFGLLFTCGMFLLARVFESPSAAYIILPITGYVFLGMSFMIDKDSSKSARLQIFSAVSSLLGFIYVCGTMIFSSSVYESTIGIISLGVISANCFYLSYKKFNPMFGVIVPVQVFAMIYESMHLFGTQYHFKYGSEYLLLMTVLVYVFGYFVKAERLKYIKYSSLVTSLINTIIIFMISAAYKPMLLTSAMICLVFTAELLLFSNKVIDKSSKDFLNYCTAILLFGLIYVGGTTVFWGSVSDAAIVLVSLGAITANCISLSIKKQGPMFGVIVPIQVFAMIYESLHLFGTQSHFKYGSEYLLLMTILIYVIGYFLKMENLKYIKYSSLVTSLINTGILFVSSVIYKPMLLSSAMICFVFTVELLLFSNKVIDKSVKELLNYSTVILLFGLICVGEVTIFWGSVSESTIGLLSLGAITANCIYLTFKKTGQMFGVIVPIQVFAMIYESLHLFQMQYHFKYGSEYLLLMTILIYVFGYLVKNETLRYIKFSSLVTSLINTGILFISSVIYKPMLLSSAMICFVFTVEMLLFSNKVIDKSIRGFLNYCTGILLFGFIYVGGITSFWGSVSDSIIVLISLGAITANCISLSLKKQGPLFGVIVPIQIFAMIYESLHLFGTQFHFKYGSEYLLLMTVLIYVFGYFLNHIESLKYIKYSSLIASLLNTCFIFGSSFVYKPLLLTSAIISFVFTAEFLLFSNKVIDKSVKELLNYCTAFLLFGSMFLIRQSYSITAIAPLAFAFFCALVIFGLHLLCIKKFSEFKIPFFYSGHVLMASLFIAILMTRQTALIYTVIFLLLELAYVYSVWVKKGLEQIGWLYAGLITFTILTGHGIMQIQRYYALDLSKYLLYLCGFLLIGLYAILKSQSLKKHVSIFLCFITAVLIFGNLITTHLLWYEYAAEIVFGTLLYLCLNHSKFDVLGFIPLALALTANHILVSSVWKDKIISLPFILIWFALFTAVGKQKYRFLFDLKNRSIDWFNIFALIGIFDLPYVYSDFHVNWISAMLPGLMGVVWLFLSRKRFGEHVGVRIGTLLFALSFVWPYYSLVSSIYSRIHEYRYEFILLPLVFLTYLCVKWIYRGVKNSNMLFLEYFIPSATYLFLLGVLCYSNDLLHGLILGIVGLISILYSSLFKTKSTLILGGALILTSVFIETRTFWFNIQWWIYLLSLGCILIVIASVNEYQKNKKNANVISKIGEALNKFSDWD